MTERSASVVIVDLVGYSEVCRVLEDLLGPDAVDKLQRRIQILIDQALDTLQKRRKEAVLKTTGDGAILEFASADDAHRFAQALHWQTEQNATKLEGAVKLQFRIGVSSGEITVPETRDASEPAGVAINRAERLQSAAQPCETVVDSTTYQLLSAENRRVYGREETIRGKRDERFRGRRSLAAAQTSHGARRRFLLAVMIGFLGGVGLGWFGANVLGIGVTPWHGITATNPFGVSLRTENGRSVYREDEPWRCVVRAEKDCYLTVVAVDSNWDAEMILPIIKRDGVLEDNHIRAGEDRIIEGDVGPPFGPVWLHAIATSKPTSVPGPWDRGGGKGVRRREGSATKLNELAPGEWGAADLVLSTQAKR